MRTIISHLAAALLVSFLGAQDASAQSAASLATGSVVRLHGRSLAPCEDWGSVVELRRDTAVIDLPLAGAVVGSSTVDCGQFTQRAVSIRELDVWNGPRDGAIRGAVRGLLIGPVAGAVIGAAADWKTLRATGGSYAIPGGAMLGFLLGPVVGGIVGAVTDGDEWTPVTSTSHSRSSNVSGMRK
jgi:hypothetical protein